MLLSKVLLILILFDPTNGGYKEGVQMFDTMKECQVAKKELETRKQGNPNLYYVLTCEKSKPTLTVQR